MSSEFHLDQIIAMTGITTSSAGLDHRRRKALYHAWHRGMREMDLMLGTFAEKELSAMSEAELDQFEAILDEPDSDLMDWITERVPLPERHDHEVMRRIRQYDGFRAS